MSDDNKDYQAGYRGNQFHHGMDRIEYERGKAEKENIDAIGRMAGGGKPVEVPGVAFTLLLIAPMIWMVYPVLGITLWAAVAGCYFLFKALHVAMHWGFLLGFILCVLAFIPGMKLEMKASQVTIYRWVRNLIRYVVPFFLVAIDVTGDSPSTLQFSLKQFTPSAAGTGLLIAAVAYFIYGRLDLLYFPAKAKIKKMQEQLKKGERPQRSMIKRMFNGACWFVPVMVVLTIIYYIVIRLFINSSTEGLAVSKQYGPIVGPINAVIWYLLCLFGKLPGTGKYLFSKEHEKDLQQIETS